MGFDPYNRSLKIRESIGTPTPQVGVTLGVWRFILSHFFALLGVRCVSQASFLSRTFISPYLGHEHKARVTTDKVIFFIPIIFWYFFIRKPSWKNYEL